MPVLWHIGHKHSYPVRFARFQNLSVKQRHVRRLRKGKCTIELGFILSDVITNFERVSDHCSNIAVCLVQVNEDEFDTHAYLDELRQEDNLDFQGKVMACREKYQLPPTKQDRVMEKNAKSKHGKSITLDSRVLEDSKFNPF